MNIRVLGYELRPLDRIQYKLYRVDVGEDGKESLTDLGKYPSTIEGGLRAIRGMAQRRARRDEILGLDEALREVERIDGEFAELARRIQESAARRGGGEG